MYWLSAVRSSRVLQIFSGRKTSVSKNVLAVVFRRVAPVAAGREAGAPEGGIVFVRAALVFGTCRALDEAGVATAL